HAAAMARTSLLERERYKPDQWAHGPKWQRYAAGGERWFGFECVRDLLGLPPEILLIPLPGHTRGHCAVALDTGNGWLLHAGDAYFYRGEMHPTTPTCTPGLELFQRFFEIDGEKRLANQARLRELVRSQGDKVRIFSAHDAVEFEALAAGRPMDVRSAVA
ncbi:MAG: MBL fold metallo-hydrolase, partial [Myxococcales bacterium]